MALGRKVLKYTSGIVGYAALSPLVLNDAEKSGRKFYEDDENVTPVPGTVVAASETQIKSLGPNKLVSGNSVRSPEPLKNFFGVVRETVADLLSKVEQKAETTSDKYYAVENKVTRTVAGLHDKNEELLPGFLYVATAFLTGSILTRTKKLYLRATVPVALGLATFSYVLPETFRNTGKFAYSLEQRNVPQLANAQDSIVKGVSDSVEFVGSTTKKTVESVESAIDSTKNYIAASTGLNLSEEVVKKSK